MWFMAPMDLLGYLWDNESTINIFVDGVYWLSTRFFKFYYYMNHGLYVEIAMYVLVFALIAVLGWYKSRRK